MRAQPLEGEDEEAMLERYRRMSPWEKLQEVGELNRQVAEAELTRIKAQYGQDLSERELRLRLAAAIYLDRETMIEVYGWDPEVEGY
jgi:hypothetical protein